MAQPPEPLDVVLRDGTRAHIRPIRPEDKAGLEQGLARLSPASRYLRFHFPVESLTAAELRYLTEIDYDAHMAWVAEDADDPRRSGMGVARYVRLADEPEVAEAAVTVVDECQGRGLGSVLLAVLSRSAIAAGIRVLRNYVLSENEAMLELLDELGATRADEGFGVYRVDMALPADPDDLPDTPAHRVLRATAKRRLPLFRNLAVRMGRGRG